jgi:polyphenol oxidase
MTTTTSTSRRSSSSGSPDRARIRRGDRIVHVRCSSRVDGDFHRLEVPFAELEARRRALADLPWSMLDERHGVTTRHVTRPGEHDGVTGDVLVTELSDTVLGCWVGDCAPVVLVGAGRRLAVAHAGWRGLAAGVLDVSVTALDEPVEQVVLGPAIGPCCYEFGDDDLRAVAAGVGVPAERLTRRTSVGTPSLDVPGAVAAFTERIGATWTRLGGCTACTFPGFSHRVRRDRQRHVVAVWQEAT